jgi:hypothetical protein
MFTLSVLGGSISVQFSAFAFGLSGLHETCRPLSHIPALDCAHNSADLRALQPQNVTAGDLREADRRGRGFARRDVR